MNCSFRHSFDVFDTLITRRCIEPHNIFLEVARECRVAEFAQARIESERQLSEKAYTLSDIYDNLANILPFKRATLLDLMHLEIDTELRNVVAIRANQELVQDGDVLISDMYLDPATILRLLEESGFQRHISLVVTTHGKRHGYIWPKVKEDFNVAQHLGDNPISDFEVPIRHGLFAVQDSTASSNISETLLRQAGFEQLSRFIREARLSLATRSLGYERYSQQCLQFSFNIPMLVLVAVHIRQIAEQYDVDRVFFSSRDCYYLYRIFRELFRGSRLETRSEYFFTSRMARVAPTESVIEALRERWTERTLVVDLCGSGWSLSQLYSTLGFEPFTFFVHALHNTEDIVESYRSLRKTHSLRKVLCITGTEELENITLEVMNYVLGGMVLCNEYLGKNNGNWLRQEEPRYPQEVRDAIGSIESCHVSALRQLRNFNVDTLTEEIVTNRDKLRSTILALYKGAEERLGCMKDVCDYHATQGDSTTQKLNQSKVMVHE